MKDKKDLYYPYIPGKSGIPFHEVKLGETKLVIGGSGRKLRVNLDKNFIRIDDLATRHCLHGLLHDENTMEFIVRTNDPYSDPKRHPDFYAREFVGFAHKHLETHHTISKVVCRWPADSSVDYAAFHSAIAKGYGEKEAALMTWSGSVIAKIGFTEVVRADKGHDHPEELLAVAVFSKPLS